MPLDIVRGPAGAGKSQYVRDHMRRGDVVLDVTRLWAALGGFERGPDGKYPEREDDGVLNLARIVRAQAIAAAVRHALSGFVTTSTSGEQHIEETFRRRGVSGAVVTLDPGIEVVRGRLADENGNLTRACESALERWYR